MKPPTKMKRCCGRLVEILYTQILVAIFASAFFTIYKSTQVISATTTSDPAAGTPRGRKSLSMEARLRKEALDRLTKEAAKYEDDDDAIKRHRDTKKKQKGPVSAMNLAVEPATTTGQEGAIVEFSKKNNKYLNPERKQFLQQRVQKQSVFEDKFEEAKQQNDNIPTKVKSKLLVQPDDFIYQKLPGESAPIVVEEFKLIFFAQAKVGCTVWKMLFRRLIGIDTWRDNSLGMPHVPERNGLTYLYHYNLTYASHILQSPEWTRAIFVRDPKERFLSAYLDKAVEEMLFVDTCCNRRRQVRCDPTPPNMHEFLQAIKTCRDSHWDPQVRRMGRRQEAEKYWPLINFVGHLETAQEDAKRLLKQLHVWEHFGLHGWGKDGRQSIFGSTDGLIHSNNAKSKVQEYLAYPELEREVETFYEADYKNRLFSFKHSPSYSTNTTTAVKDRPIVEPRDWIYRKDKKDGEAAPIVIEKYKLVFFLVPNVADLEFKRLFLRMMGQEDWKTRNYARNNHQAFAEGLNFLYNYNLTYASHMMTAPDWTRAVFTRDPKERFVLSYTETAVANRKLLANICCYKMPKMFCLKRGPKNKVDASDVPNATEFLTGIGTCKSSLWDPQTERLNALYRLGLNVGQKKAFDPEYFTKSKYWKYLNFVGSMSNAAADAKAMLERVGAWSEFGESGWADEYGKKGAGHDSLFTSTSFLKDELKLKKRLTEIISDPQMEQVVERLFASDYNNPHFKLTKKSIYSLGGKTYRDDVNALETLRKGDKTQFKREW